VSGLLLDTHVIVWSASGGKVPADVQTEIENAAARDQLFVSAISAWEITRLAALGRIATTTPPCEWFSRLVESSGVIVIPLSLECAIDAALLPPIHRDPADRFLVATARFNDLSLVTHDRNIHRYAEAGLVKVVIC
jgi:PIN domain nuclease of toxin-antitoxin system